MNDEPWDLLDRDAPSELTIDAYVTGEADERQIAAIEARCRQDDTFRVVVEACKQGFGALPMTDPAALRARLEARLAQDARPADPEPTQGGWLAWLLGWRGGGLLAAAAAAALLLIVWPGDRSHNPGSLDLVTAKGAFGMRIYRSRGEAVEELLNGATLVAGDRLRFQADRPLPPGHVLVVGVEASGTVFGYPPTRGHSIPTTAVADDGALPGAAQVDDSRGEEWAYLIWCPNPFDPTVVRAGREPGRLDLPDGCRAAGLRLVKP